MKMKKTKVTRKFLLDLANDIYNPKTKKFLRLCDGSLQAGVDPTNSKRQMHCGLGELYFAMTGLHPALTGVSEDDVVELALERSPLATEAEVTSAQAVKGIKKLKLPKWAEEELLEAASSFDGPEYETQQFRDVLSEIPDENDGVCGVGDADYCDRSKRVAAKLREAAALLPAEKK